MPISRVLMYNLFVAGRVGTWDEPFFEIELARVAREFTSDALEERFAKLDAAAIDELKRLPALFAYEQVHKLPARLGWIQQVQQRDADVRVKFAFEPDVPPIPSDKLEELNWDLNIGKWEMNRTHWAIKEPHLLEALVDGGVLDIELIRTRPPESRIVQAWLDKADAGMAAPVEARPVLFRTPARPQEPDLVSVMMPFAGMALVYDAIRAACAQAHMRCERADDIWEEAEVIQDIFSLIYRSNIVVCDFTGRNPNVFYEAGIAHTLGREVIPIVQNAADIPFDLRHHRFLEYLNNDQGRAELTGKLSKRLQTLARQRVR